MTHELENLLQRSVLSHLPPGFVSKFVLPNLKTQNLSLGEYVRRPESPESVFIVLRGKVGLFIGDDQIGAVDAGRALELAPVIEQSKEWAYQWKAVSAATVVHFPAAVLLRAFDEDEDLRSYLSRMTGHRSIQRFKHDLNLLGFSPELARSTITAFVHVSSAKLAAAPANDQVILVDQGALEIQSKRGGDLYKSGDVVAVLQKDKPKIVPNGDGKCWVLERKKWEALASRELVANAFEVLLGGADELGSISLPFSDGGLTDSEIDEDDEEDSEEAFDAEEFAANPNDRVRLSRLNKLPFVAQHDAMDCGAACLAMVLEFYNKRISISRIRGILNVAQDGASLADMVRAAGELGLECDAIETSLEDLDTMRMPAIVLLEYHYVVIYQIQEDYVLISDPATGRLRVPRSEFERDFSQLCLLLKPGPKLESIPNDQKKFWKYSSLLHGHRLDLSRAGLAVVFLFVLNLIYPIFMQLIFDEVLIKNQLGTLSVFLIGFIALSVARVFTEAIRDYLFLNFAAKFDLKVNSLFLRHAMALPFSYFAVRRTGDFLSRMDELEKIRDFISGKPIILLINLLSIVVFGTALYLYNPAFLGIILLGIPIYAFVVVKVSGYLQPILDWKFKSGARAESKYLESVTHLDTVRMQNSGISARWRWESEIIDGMAADRKYHYTAVLSDGLLELLEYTFSCSIMLTAAYLYSKGELTVGQVIAVSAMGTQLLGPVLDILKEWQSISEVAFSFSKIDDVFATRRENMRTAQARHELKGHVELRDVTFRYGGDGSPTVLDSISLEIRPGESIALVGASGSGKSTLANMINLLYQPSAGSVQFDGQPGIAFELEHMRRQVAMIVQDNSIFTGTVLENIALGDKTPSLKRAIEAAKLADAHDFISKLGKGYLHPLTPNPELSGGEKQRLCIARAFYLKPKILILDEATSALDSLSERKIIKNLESFGATMTKVTIAHRLNSVVNADRIIVLDHGRIVEEGSHRVLLKRRGIYYNLFKKQLSA